MQMNFLGKNFNFRKKDAVENIFFTQFLDHQIKGIDFNLGDGTESYFACTMVFQGEQLVLGGKREYNQFSKVESCGLKRTENNLPFTENLFAQVYCGAYTFNRGVYQEPTEIALICRHQQCFT